MTCLLLHCSIYCRPVRRILVGGFFTKLRWTFPEGEARIHCYSARNALLGGSGGMPPRKILDFRLSEIDSGAVSGQISYEVSDPSSSKHYNMLLIDLERTFLPQFWLVGGFVRTPRTPPAYGPETASRSYISYCTCTVLSDFQ